MDVNVLGWTFVGLAVAIGSSNLPAASDTKSRTERIALLVKQLGDDKFAKRETASRELKAIGESALPALKKAIESDDLEVQIRAAQLVRWITDDLSLKDQAELKGTWEITNTIHSGKSRLPPKTEHENPVRILFEGSEIFTVRDGEKEPEAWADFTTHPGRSPKAIDITPRLSPYEIKTSRGIYEIKGNQLRWCYGPLLEESPRPTQFSSTPENRQVIEVWKRVEKRQQ